MCQTYITTKNNPPILVIPIVSSLRLAAWHRWQQGALRPDVSWFLFLKTENTSKTWCKSVCINWTQRGKMEENWKYGCKSDQIWIWLTQYKFPKSLHIRPFKKIVSSTTPAPQRRIVNPPNANAHSCRSCKFNPAHNLRQKKSLSIKLVCFWCLWLTKIMF